MKKQTLVWAIALLLLVPTVFGLGVSPAWQDHDFEPNKKIESSIRLINDANEDFRALVFAKGTFSDKVKFDEQIIEISSTQSEVYVPFTYTMPERIFMPGKHTTEIIILMMPPYESEEAYLEDGMIIPAKAAVSATKQVIAKINTNVPFDGKHIDPHIYIRPGDVGKSTVFSVAIYNIGTDDINKINAKIQIVDPNNNTIDEVETDSLSLQSKKEGRIEGSWVSSQPGDYHARAIIQYDGYEQEVIKNFHVGNLHVNITNVAVEHFELGEIVKLDIYVKSLWNKPLKDVYAVFKVYEGEKMILKYKTTSVDIAENGDSILHAFWDTRDFGPGAYPIKIELFYGDDHTENEFDAMLDYDNIVIRGFGSTGQMVTGKPAFGRDSLLTSLVAILILVNIFWFIYFKRRGKSKEEKKEKEKEKASESQKETVPEPKEKKAKVPEKEPPKPDSEEKTQAKPEASKEVFKEEENKGSNT